MNFTAKDVASLRQMTGAGMMTCKEVLVEADGDMNKAKRLLRVKGLQQATTKANRTTAAGLVGTYVYYDETGAATGSILEVKCETDFVAKNSEFQTFVIDSLVDGVRVGKIPAIVAKIGENIRYGRAQLMSGGCVIGSYMHGSVFKENTTELGTIGVLVTLNGVIGDTLAELAYKIAMHIAASNPKAITQADLDPKFVKQETDILTEQVMKLGKPANMVEKIVQGKLNKVLRDVCLVNQLFVMDQNKTIEQLLDENKATVLEFIRYKIGE